MNTKLIIWIAGIFLGAIVVASVWYFLFAPKAVTQTSWPNAMLPISGSVAPTPTEPSSATSSPTGQRITLAAQNGGTVIANDFIHNGVTIPDTANAGRYLLAGNFGYCLSDPQKCQAATADNFSVYYNMTTQSFILTLTKEPIGQARLDMEQFMLATLGITEQQMCSLNYLIGVTRYVNEQYAGKNLGFSFCPGATKLPK
ncbi:MAG: hypothetical protein Q7R59_00440 [bacterium]|nr:hypothetical protein [bacterium]